MFVILIQMGLDSAKWSIWCVLVLSLYSVACSLEFRYHKNEELEGVMRNLSDIADNRIRTHLYSIGNSSSSVFDVLNNIVNVLNMQNNSDEIKKIIPNVGDAIDYKPKHRQPLWVLEITASELGKIGVPNVKLIGNMHGNEADAREVLLHLIEFLIKSYGKNETVTWLLNNTRVHILPTLNPDGFDMAGNACESTVGRGVPFGNTTVDLNRNFPDCFDTDEELNERVKPSGKKYPNCKNVYGVMKDDMTNEAKAVVNWMEDHMFILSAALHGGELVVNYPFDSKHDGDKTTKECPTPDDDVFRHLARTYSNNHPRMHLGEKCRSRSFEGGITNGAMWYSFKGGMGDYNYAFQGCMELTVEISCCKYSKTGLDLVWMANKESLLHFIMQANRGVTGQILDLYTGKPIEAILSIVGREMKFQSFKKTGEFWRILLPGSYKLQVNAEGYHPENIKFNVSSNDSNYHQLTFLRIFLTNSSIPTTSTTMSTTKSMFEEYISEYIPLISYRFAENNDTIILLESKQSSSIMNNYPIYILLGSIYVTIIIL